MALFNVRIFGIGTMVLFACVVMCAWETRSSPVPTGKFQTPKEIRYLAANGDDSNDGKTPATAWSTVERLNEGLPAGGTALLRSGDVFYGTIRVKGGIDRNHKTVISSYGSGARPVISCTKNLRDDPSMWHSQHVRYNFWSVDLKNPSNYTGLVSSDNTNPGFLIVDGEVKPWKLFSRYDINKQWDFSDDDGRLFVFSTNNPALLAHDIRVAVGEPGLQLFSHMVVSNLAIRATGSHGMYTEWDKTPKVDMRISDCIFENIGGSELINYSLDSRVRFGNGVEFGPNSADAIVERCEFRGVYDVAFTMQGRSPAISWDNIHMRNCIVEDSSQAFEVWCSGAPSGVGFTRCSFTGNRTVNVGGGWGALTRPNRSTATPLLVYRMTTDTIDITITRNVFENLSHGLIFVLDGVESLSQGYRIYGNEVK